MPKFNIRLNLSDWMAYSLEEISQKTGIDYTNLIRQAIKEFIDREIGEKESKEVDGCMIERSKLNLLGS